MPSKRTKNQVLGELKELLQSIGAHGDDLKMKKRLNAKDQKTFQKRLNKILAEN